MRKKPSNHQKQENERGLPGSIIAMDNRSVNRLFQPEQTANLGIGALERRNRALRSSRDRAHEWSVSFVAGTGTNGISAFTRVVSGCGAEEWEKAAYER